MKQTHQILRSLLGNAGFDTLQKAIYKRGSQSVLDPLEFLLPLIVVPRTIISWLVSNIKPLKVGEYKEFEFPGKSEIKMWVEKQDIDVYRGEFRQDGKIIQTFDKQSLPTVAASMMTTGELYGSDDTIISSRKEMIDEHEQLVEVLESDSHKDDKEEAEKQRKELEEYKKHDSSPVIGWIIKKAEISKEIPKDIPKISGAQLASFTEKIGKLIDVLMLNKALPTMPSGTAIPAKPKLPKAPIPPSNISPTAQAGKQAQSNSMGSKNPAHASQQPLKPKQQKSLTMAPMPKVEMNGNYFRKKLAGSVTKTTKSEDTFIVSEQDAYRPCVHCGVAEFVKGEDGHPHFKPCACFMVEKTERFGKKDFVTLVKTETGYALSFNKDADPESVRAFLLTLKAKLLVSKKLNKYGK